MPMPMPILLVLAENAPPQSKAEMSAMVELNVSTVSLAGTLGIYEEYPKAVEKAINSFI